MKNKLHHLLLLLVLLGSQSACKKIFEHIPQPSEPKNDYTQCRVKKITGTWDAGILHAEYFLLYKGTLIFSYNAAGNPVSIGIQDSIVTASYLPPDEDLTKLARYFPYRLFRYDNQNKLTDLIEPKNPNLSMDSGYRRWHRYGYNGSNQIIADTLYAEGTEVNGRPSSTSFTVTSISYDAEGRVIPPASYIYASETPHYDPQGNLTLGEFSPPGYGYDTSLINPLRTNKIWMFLGKNYSTNALKINTQEDPRNPAFSTPNGCKLPTYFNVNQDFYLVPYTDSYYAKFFDISWIEMVNIEYECSCDCSTNAALK